MKCKYFFSGGIGKVINEYIYPGKRYECVKKPDYITDRPEYIFCLVGREEEQQWEENPREYW